MRPVNTHFTAMSERRSIDIRNKLKEVIAVVWCDEQDWTALTRVRWCLDTDSYASGGRTAAKLGMKTKMHAEVVALMGLTVPDMHVIDHIDNNKLNCCRSNLRVVSRSQNAQNKAKRANSSSRYFGVIWFKQRKVWRASHAGKYLGDFTNESAAAYAYDEHVQSMYDNPKINGVLKPDQDYRKPKRGNTYNIAKWVSLSREGRFVAKVDKYLGTYDTVEEASAVVAAFCKARESELHLLHHSSPILRNNEGCACIRTKKGEEILVDDEEWHKLSLHSWHINHGGYAGGWVQRSPIVMHRYIMNPLPSEQVEHINGQRLDNRKSNLRICSPQENSSNKVKRKECTSQFQGVCKYVDRRRGRMKDLWSAYYAKSNVLENLGQYEDESVAAWIRDCRVKELGDTFSKLNDVSQPKGWYYADKRGKRIDDLYEDLSDSDPLPNLRKRALPDDILESLPTKRLKTD